MLLLELLLPPLFECWKADGVGLVAVLDEMMNELA